VYINLRQDPHSYFDLFCCEAQPTTWKSHELLLKFLFCRHQQSTLFAKVLQKADILSLWENHIYSVTRLSFQVFYFNPKLKQENKPKVYDISQPAGSVKTLQLTNRLDFNRDVQGWKDVGHVFPSDRKSPKVESFVYNLLFVRRSPVFSWPCWVGGVVVSPWMLRFAGGQVWPGEG